ncbi:MAG TPA: PTS fructose transporter subunit IIA [Burkholderiales bacterium]|nr:PTS fructose transporter subunit IIA [Burkholderiales bacterium]
MVGLLIVAHGTLGESLIHCASHVLGSRPMHLMQIGVTVHDDPQQLLPQAIKLVKQLDRGDGVVVLTDLYGATPANLAAKLLVPGRVEGVAGVNLPMLVRALTYRNEPLKVVVSKAISGGVEGVMQVPPASLEHAATGS